MHKTTWLLGVLFWIGAVFLVQHGHEITALFFAMIAGAIALSAPRRV